MNQNNKLSVVIATMNRTESLRDTLEYLEKSSVLPTEVIVVDQSTNTEIHSENLKLCEQINMNVQVFFREPSLTAARNFGITKAENDVVIFMDDDVRVQENTIENITKLMSDSTISMIGGLDEKPSMTKSLIGYLFGKKSYFKRNIGHVTGALYGRYPMVIDKETPTQWAMGYFFVVRKSLVEKWNLDWDERFLSYGYPEDLDFSFRYYREAKKEGLKCIITPDVTVKHMCSQEWREIPSKVTYMYIVHREYLTYKWGLGFWSRVQTRWSNFGMLLERLMHRNNAVDVIKAQLFCDTYRKDIKKGILHSELYMK
ncbi:MAG: glycosyltransferase family 2 protein [Clostridia bacterium]|nr:glycosyltransferase family 2 protein [Clostridia bacterium]